MAGFNNVSAWSYELTPSPSEVSRLTVFIGEETAYYNSVISGLAAPIRSIGDTLMELTGRWEELFGLAAALGVNPLAQSTQKLREFERFGDLIEAADARKSLIFDVATAPGHIASTVRRGIAIEALKAARDQVNAMRDTVNSDTQVYRYMVTTLSQYEPGQKRHIQIPVQACLVTDLENGKVAIKIPYLDEPITVSAPPFKWNLMVIKNEGSGWSMTLLREKSLYLLGRTDAPGLRKRRKKPTRRSSEKV